MKYLLIIDAQNDFINGSLKCLNAEPALDKIIAFINNHPEFNTIYSLDWHSKTNKSFINNGGMWPQHCIVGTHGAEINELFSKLKDKSKSPNENNKFYKGINDDIEEYSAYLARNDQKKAIGDILSPSDEIVICGYALDYCIKETTNELLNSGFSNITIYKDLVGYVNQGDYDKALITFKNKGIKII